VLLLGLCGCRLSSVSIFSIACGFLQVDLGLVLELPNKKAQSFLISIALNRLFFGLSFVVSLVHVLDIIDLCFGCDS
jgi:hypothetical protein